jgi:large subunit ribosomal protein L10
MPLNLEDKKVLVAEVTEVAKTALSVVAAEYRGLTVTQMTDLRAKARAQGVYMRVVKNTLARKAFAGTAFEPVGPKLKGPLVLAFSKDDPGAAARVVKAFAKDHEKLVATLVSIGGEVLSAKDLEKVASLPRALRRCRNFSACSRRPSRSSSARSPRRTRSWCAPSRPSAMRSRQPHKYCQSL